MYLRNIKPRTTCLYSAASMFLRSLSADFQSCFSMGSSLVSIAFLGRAISYSIRGISRARGAEPELRLGRSVEREYDYSIYRTVY
jgi:hypothetical protein